MGFFSVIAKPQTYSNMLYLLLSFPLGIFYFVFLITGLSVGIGTLIVWVGVPILLGMMFAWWALATFERHLADSLLNVKIKYKDPKLGKVKSLWKRFVKHFTDMHTWTSLFYLILKFPLGIISFVILVTFISISLSFIAVPILYFLSNSGVLPAITCSGYFCPSYGTTSIVGIVGIFFLFVSLHAFNGLAYVSGYMAKGMLERR